MILSPKQMSGGRMKRMAALTDREEAKKWQAGQFDLSVIESSV